MTIKHIITQEGDEHVCSCGLRWGVDEEDPHRGERESWDVLEDYEALYLQRMKDMCK